MTETIQKMAEPDRRDGRISQKRVQDQSEEMTETIQKMAEPDIRDGRTSQKR